MTSLCNRQKRPHCGLETENWAACLRVGSKSSSHLQGHSVASKDRQLRMLALKASQAPVVWQKKRSLSNQEVVLGSKLTLDFSRQGWDS